MAKAFLLCLFAMPASAQNITVVKELNFGEAVVTNNSSPHSITIQTNGSFTASNAFVFLEIPTEGQYVFENLPVNTTVSSITVQVDQQMIGPGEDFIIDNFDIDGETITDDAGELEFNLGARLRTTGSGANYLQNADFESALTITINF